MFGVSAYRRAAHAVHGCLAKLRLDRALENEESTGHVVVFVRVRAPWAVCLRRCDALAGLNHVAGQDNRGFRGPCTRGPPQM